MMDKGSFVTNATFIPDNKNEDSQNLKTWIVATHSDLEINNRIYPGYVMKREVKTWTSPYRKPVLAHHDDNADAIGRVLEAYYFDSADKMSAERLINKEIDVPAGASGFILLRANISDPRAIDKILDDRYMTVSIGFASHRAVCSICGNNWAEKPCKHIPGRKYDDEKALLIMESMDFKEISFVNNPADVHAQVVIKEKEDASMEIDANKDNVTVSGDEMEKHAVKIPKAKKLKDMTFEEFYQVVLQEDTEEENEKQAAYIDEEQNNEEDSEMVSQEKFETLQKRFDELYDFVKGLLIDKIIEAKKAMGVKGYDDEEFVEKKREMYLKRDLQILTTIVDELNETMFEEECEECESDEKTEEDAQEETNEETTTDEEETTEADGENEEKDAEETDNEEEVETDTEESEETDEDAEETETDEEETDNTDEDTDKNEDSDEENVSEDDKNEDSEETETETDSEEEATNEDKEDVKNGGITREDPPSVMSNGATSKKVENSQDVARRKLGI